jgi:hypothetical protein
MAGLILARAQFRLLTSGFFFPQSVFHLWLKFGAYFTNR